MKNLRLPLVLTLSLFFFAISLITVAAQQKKPKLILQITVDGLRGDLPNKYKDRFGKGGFRYLLEKGTHYTNAHYQHANTETIVGHTTLATGAFPADHGMIGNLWLDQESGELTYNIEDDQFAIVGQGIGVDKKTEIDPTQRAARTDGRSPRAILASTFSDELALASNSQAKIFGISVKDRGAVPPAGHAGKAFWFNKKSGGFVSSTYYYDKYPEWVSEWNNEKIADAYKNGQWNLRDDPQSYLKIESDDRPYEIDLKGYGRVFPHLFGNDPKYLYTFLTLSPIGDTLTLNFAKSLVEHEQLGADQITDYLSVSFSSTDYINHLFGPASLEAEDNLLRLDQTLAELFDFIDNKIGLENTLIVLSADHGSPEASEHMAHLGMDTVRLSPERVNSNDLIAALEMEFGLGKELIKIYYHPYIYLDRKLIIEKGLGQLAVERVVAAETLKFPGIAAALSSKALERTNYINSAMGQAVKNNFHPKRSGDIYIIQNPYNHLVSDESTPLAAMHGSPWRYDTFVPIFVAGAKVPAQKINRLVHPVDIAITLSNYMEIKPPSSAAGEVLLEIYKNNQE